MKYEKEIDELFRSLFYEDWMSDEEFQELVFSKISKQQMSDDIEIGVQNGYSLEVQLKLVKNILKLNEK